MDNSFYIVDDDVTVRRILTRIIDEHDMGRVVGESPDGLDAKQQIAALVPDIALIDLLLPGVDGISLVASIRDECPQTCFVMLSQVTDKELVEKAYQAGVDFFISKPINVIEVVSVLKQIRERMHMENIIHSLREVIGGVEQPAPRGNAAGDPGAIRRQVKNALVKLGIIGEAGSGDIEEICLLLMEKPSTYHKGFKLSELYGSLAARYTERQNGHVNSASVEQRVRRAVNKALNNIANLGVEDYGNEFFLSFGSAFFDFTEVRRQMNYIRGISDTPGKINVRKFIEGLVTLIESE